jgi:hypothetical protein
MDKKQSKSRRLCFTIPNYSEEDLARFHLLAESLEKHCYISYGLETGETGFPHIQGYVELNSAQRFAYLQKYFNSILRLQTVPRMRIESTHRKKVLVLNMENH